MRTICVPALSHTQDLPAVLGTPSVAVGLSAASYRYSPLPHAVETEKRIVDWTQASAQDFPCTGLALMASGLPESLTAIAPYVTRARELQRASPTIAHHLRLMAVTVGIALKVDDLEAKRSLLPISSCPLIASTTPPSP